MKQIKGVGETTARLIQFALDNGWEVSRNKRHPTFRKKDHTTVFHSSTSSDRRAALNTRSQLKRAMKNAEGNPA